jgi:hypothetical protein
MEGDVKFKIYSYRQQLEFNLPTTLRGEMVADVSKERSDSIFRAKQ